METQEFKNKIEEVGKIIGMIADFPSDEDMHWHRWAHLKKDQQSIRVSNGDYQEQNKLHISGAFPTSIKGESSRYGNPIDINVSVSKTPEQIARDIERRLLPLYLPELEKAIDRVNRMNTYHQKREANIRKMAEYFGVEFKPDKDPSIYVYDKIPGLGSRIETSGEENVKFTLEVAPDLTIKVFDLLKEVNQNENL